MATEASAGTRKSRALTDPDEIRKWAEERGGCPARVKGTGGGKDVGMIRIDFPGYSGQQSLEPISWEDFFAKFEERQLALVVENQDPKGDKARFNKLVSRHNEKLEGHKQS